MAPTSSRRRGAALLLCLAALALVGEARTPSAHDSEEEDFYDILGVDESATANEIKKAYRKLSLKHHPDKGGDARLFKRVTRAYEVLSDGEKRALYEAGGMEAVDKGVGQRDMFGRAQGVQRGSDVSVSVNVPLEDVYKGGSVRVSVTRRVVCRGCGAKARQQRSSASSYWRRSGGGDGDGGGGGDGGDKCAQCSASCPPTTRVVQQRMGMMIMNREIEEPSKERCKQEEKLLHATIERGAAEGAEITFQRASEQTPGKIPGNVVVRLRSARHAVFRREGTPRQSRHTRAPRLIAC